MNNEPIVVKLVSGDMFMAYLLNSTEDTLLVQDPITVKTVQIQTEGGVVEKAITQPFCSLTLEREFSIDMRLVIFVKPLNPKIAGYYRRIVGSYSEDDEPEEDFLYAGFDQEDDHEEHDQESILVIPDKHSLH